jgi:CubicO group peptidase (beta-lactamase class C family)
MGRRILAAAGWLLMVPPGLAFAQRQPVPPTLPPRLDSSITRFMTTNHVPGLAAALVLHGEYVWSHGFGMADLENLVPVTPQTLFRLASVSKTLTSTGAIELWEAGKLDLDAPVQRYCPSFPTKRWPITTREVLSHLGGIRHYNSEKQDDPEIGNTRHFSDPIAGGFSFFAADSLIAQPGTRYNYSTQGYTLVGCVIQGASGEPYVEYMHRRVFTPVGMSHTIVDDRYKIIPWRTRFYHWDSAGGVVNADLLDASYKVPGGGWLSSADDLARFELALLHDSLVRRSTRTLAWTPARTADGKATDYGLGWGVDTTGGVHRVGHAGGQQGTSTAIIMIPEMDAGVVVLANIDDVNIWLLGRDLLTLATAAREPAH